MLEHEVAVEQDRLNLGQKRIAAVDVRPARLHHPDLGIGEVMDALEQKIRGRNKVGVENGNELALRRLQPLSQRPRLVALAVVAVMIGDRMPKRGIPLHQDACDLYGLVGRVVEQLDVQLFAWVLQPADRVQQAVHHILLIKNRQLNGDARQVVETGRRLSGLFVLVFVIKIDQPVAVRAVGRQNNQHNEIRNQQRQVEGVDLVEPLECLVQKVLPDVWQHALGGEVQRQNRGCEGPSHDFKRTESGENIVPDR